MGKWAKLKQQYEPLPPELQEGGEKYQERVARTADEIGQKTATELAALYETARQLADVAEAAASDARLRCRALERLIVGAYEAEGLESLKLTSGRAVRTEVGIYPSVEDPALVMAWVRERGLESKLSFPWQSLRSETAQLLEENLPPPPGVKIYYRTIVKLA